MFDAEIVKSHNALSADVRDVRWISNCAGEVFLLDGLRIGHFQGDAALADFVCAVHNAMLDNMNQEEKK